MFLLIIKYQYLTHNVTLAKICPQIQCNIRKKFTWSL